MILVNAFYTIIDSFTRDTSEVMQFISGYVATGGASMRTAMSWIYFLIVIAIIAAVAGLLSAYIFYQKRD